MEEQHRMHKCDLQCDVRSVNLESKAEKEDHESCKDECDVELKQMVNDHREELLRMNEL